MVGNCYVFQPTDEWNRPIESDPVDFQSDCILDRMAAQVASGDASRGYATMMVRLDVGTMTQDTYGMRYNLFTAASPAHTPITYGTDGENYSDESDWFDAQGVLRSGAPGVPAFFPFPAGMAIEGWGGTTATDPSGGDRHIIVVDGVACRLYESWNTVRLANGYQASNTAAWDMALGNNQRPAGWTSGDAAGMAIFPGVLRYSEVASGSIPHALRFTAPMAQNAYASPGRHLGPSGNRDVTLPFYGARFRLKASFDASGYSADTQVLIAALKKYGLIFADQGTGAYVTGDNDPGFDVDMLAELNQGNAGPASKRIPFDKDHWELVQNPNAVTRGFNPGTISCNGVTTNANPAWQPNWTPSCPPMANWP